MYLYICHRSAVLGDTFLVVLGHPWPTYKKDGLGLQWQFKPPTLTVTNMNCRTRSEQYRRNQKTNASNDSK